MSGPDPFPEKIRNFDLRNRKTQLILASGVAALLLVIGLIALPGGHRKTASKTSGDTQSTTDTGPGAAGASGALGGSSGSNPLSGNGSSGGRSSADVSASG